MSIEEFQTMGGWIIRFVVYGGLAAIAIGILIVIVNNLRANLRSRGILGLLINIIQLLVLAGIIIIMINFANQIGWIEQFKAWLP